MAAIRFCFQSDEKPPPGSQLLVTQQVSLICYIVLFASSTSYHPAATKEVRAAYKQARRNLRHHASRLRPNRVGLMCLWAALL